MQRRGEDQKCETWLRRAKKRTRNGAGKENHLEDGKDSIFTYLDKNSWAE